VFTASSDGGSSCVVGGLGERRVIGDALETEQLDRFGLPASMLGR
jgi:hypothetical protein